MKWYKDILHLFTKLSDQSFQNILSYGTIARALTNLVVSTIVLYGMTCLTIASESNSAYAGHKAYDRLCTF